MKTAKDLARRKMASSVSEAELLQTMGPYSHRDQRRWVGQDVSFMKWAEKSDTSFDNESKDPD
jgi:hypothetical protein